MEVETQGRGGGGLNRGRRPKAGGEEGRIEEGDPRQEKRRAEWRPETQGTGRGGQNRGQRPKAGGEEGRIEAGDPRQGKRRAE